MWQTVNSIARNIKALDPNHPVGVPLAYASLATSVPFIKAYAPAIDFIGVEGGAPPLVRSSTGDLCSTRRMPV